MKSAGRKFSSSLFVIPFVFKIGKHLFEIYVVPPRSWGDQGDTKHLQCLLVGGRWLNQKTLIPKPRESGGARAAMAQVGPANKRNDTKMMLTV